MDPTNKISDKFDFIIIGSVLTLLAMGLMAIYSATNAHPTAQGNFQKQLFTGILGLILFFIAFFIPYKTFRYIAFPSYIFSILLLIGVLIFGKTVYGAKSWISLGPIGFQPAEFAKIGLILFVAHFLTRQRKNPNNILDLLTIIGFGFIPIILILLEPDLGTAIVYVIIITAMLFWSGVDLFWFFLFLSPVIVVFAFEQEYPDLGITIFFTIINPTLGASF